MPHSAASELGLHCLYNNPKLASGLKRVNFFLLQFRVQVYDDGEPDYIAEADVLIYVDVNPSGPLFELDPYSFEIHETYTEGTEILDTNAFDLDGVSKALNYYGIFLLFILP